MYCHLCLEAGEQHKHLPALRITKIIEEIFENLIKEIKKLKKVIEKSKPKYNGLYPIIMYLEAVTLESEPQELYHYPVRYQISSDFSRLSSLNQKLTGLY